MTAPVVFIDCETTGLDPREHEVWEIGLIDADGVETVWRPKPHALYRADSTALRMTRFYERTGDPVWVWQKESAVALELATATEGQHLVGAVPSFDATFLTELLRRAGLSPAWHYHLVDVETLAAGKLGMSPPWNSEELSRQVGVEPPSDQDRHTALGDARWARAVYQAVLTPPDPRP